jgi:hypothetical protein
VQATVYDPLVMGVDVARFGDDASVIRIRRGRDARTIPPVKLRGIDTMVLAARIAELYEEYHPDAIFVDEGGVGGGVIDRCRMLQLPVVGIQFGARADRNIQSDEGAVSYANKRAEMWGLMKDWLKGGMLDVDPDMLADLTGVEYGYKMLDGRDAILLEKKSDMKRRGLSSPDNGDALALTFAYPVQPSDHAAKITGSRGKRFESDYNPMESAWGIGKQQPQRQGWTPGGNR